MGNRVTIIGASPPNYVRQHADGTLSLKPRVDFRAPGQQLPEPIRPSQPPAPGPAAVTVTEHRIPAFLLKRLPRLVLLPGGQA